MASDYRAADGENVVLGSLTVLSPQPTADLLAATQRTFAADGTIYDQGLYVIWRWSIVQNETEYQSILTTLGINSATTNRITIYTRSPVGTYTRYNGTAVRPNPGSDIQQRDYFLRNVEVVIKDIETAT